MSFLVSLIVLSLLIFFHELGHFLVARYFGVTVHTFSIGFGKKIWSKKYGDTEYRLSLIPLGGFVQMKGQDDLDPKLRNNDADSYNSKTPLQRIGILFAGPFANFLVAFVLFIMIGFLGDTRLAPKIGDVIDGSPAKQAGLQKNDTIIAINGIDVYSWDSMSKIIKESNTAIMLKINRNNEILAIEVDPKLNDSKSIFGEQIKKRMIGIAPSGDSVVLYHTGFEAITFAYNETIEASKMIVMGIQKLIEGIVPVSEVGGVVSIVQVTSKASEIGIVALFTLTALISVNLGILNLLPIPALDGGHIIFNIYEMITKKIPSMNVIYKLTLMGWVLLLALMLLGLYNDINRLLK